jgi:gliding motility-associated-like protein
VSDIRDAKALFTVLAEGTYQLTLVQDNGACQAQDQVEVVLKGSPSGSLSTTSEVCGTTTQNVTLDFGFTGNGPWDYTFSDGAETFTYTATAPVTTQTLPVTGETTFAFTRIMDINGCSATPQQMGGSTTIVDLEPSPNAGNDLAVCDTEVALEGIASSYPGVWSGPSGLSFDDATAPNTKVTSSEYGNYSLTWTEFNGTCSASDEMEVRFDQTPTPVDAGGDMKLYHEYQTTLNAKVPVAGEGLWSVISGPGQLTSPENPNAQISGMEMGSTTLLWTVTNGVCAAITDTLVITVEGLIYFNGFSPNGDGYNDTFRILGAEEIPNNELIVFNLQGKVVYREKNMTDVGWDGRDLSGSLLDDGNYYFVFTGDRINAVKDYLVIKTR